MTITQPYDLTLAELVATDCPAFLDDGSPAGPWPCVHPPGHGGDHSLSTFAELGELGELDQAAADDPWFETGVGVVYEPERPAMDFSPQQLEAIARVKDWYANGTEQVFRLFGYAGTGKTTLAKYIVDELGIYALYAAFTGKAAYVLRTKGCEGAATVHSLIYSPQEKVRARLNELQEQLRKLEQPDVLLSGEDFSAEIERLQRAIKVESDRLATPDFILREDSPLNGCPLLVLDEVSMIGTKIAADLLSFDCKILCLGDPAQLPPVEGGGYFINAPADHLLTEIHRSALDSPVTRLASSVRQSPPGDRTLGMPGMDGHSGRTNAVTRQDLATFDQVLVGTNKTRWQAIHLLRELQGLIGSLPMVGDRIIGLANSVEADIFNGQQFTVIKAELADRADRIRLIVLDDAGDVRPLTVWASGFSGIEGEKTAKREGRGSIAAATFAQAITVHKSQGSQWNSVLVVDESHIFARAEGDEMRRAGKSIAESGAAAHIAGQRWLYTAITRAAQRVVVIASPRGLPS